MNIFESLRPNQQPSKSFQEQEMILKSLSEISDPHEMFDYVTLNVIELIGDLGQRLVKRNQLITYWQVAKNLLPDNTIKDLFYAIPFYLLNKYDPEYLFKGKMAEVIYNILNGGISIKSELSSLNSVGLALGMVDFNIRVGDHASESVYNGNEFIDYFIELSFKELDFYAIDRNITFEKTGEGYSIGLNVFGKDLLIGNFHKSYYRSKQLYYINSFLCKLKHESTNYDQFLTKVKNSFYLDDYIPDTNFIFRDVIVIEKKDLIKEPKVQLFDSDLPF